MEDATEESSSSSSDSVIDFGQLGKKREKGREKKQKKEPKGSNSLLTLFFRFYEIGCTQIFVTNKVNIWKVFFVLLIASKLWFNNPLLNKDNHSCSLFC